VGRPPPHWAVSFLLGSWNLEIHFKKLGFRLGSDLAMRSKPAWKISPGVGLNFYLEIDAHAPQEWALSQCSPEVVPHVRQRRETDH
jgi:hypothetical protein